MNIDLTLIWALIIVVAVFIYVVLDGFDLGIGILFNTFEVGHERDTAMNSIAPVWDGNETWLVLGGGGLLAAFPLAYGLIFSALGRIPARGEVVQALAGFEFHILDADPRRIKRVRVARKRAGARRRSTTKGEVDTRADGDVDAKATKVDAPAQGETAPKARAKAPAKPRATKAGVKSSEPSNEPVAESVETPLESTDRPSI